LTVIISRDVKQSEDMAMTKERATRKFYFISNYLWLDFINTEAAAEGRPVNLLTDFDDLMAWLVEAKVLDGQQAKDLAAAWGGRPEAQRTLARALEFRRVLRQMAERLVQGKPVPPATITSINDLLNNQVSYAEVRRTRGGFEKRLHANFTEPEHLLLPIAESAGNLLCYGDLSRIKKCENAACVLFFYDTTKNHSRRWCSMSACGNRMKVAAHYRRLRKTNAG
jgi:predicted RNA-binding Zn ribbon-like protein